MATFNSEPGREERKRRNHKHIFRQRHLPCTTETLGNPSYATQWRQLPHAQQKQHNIPLRMDQQSHKKKTSQSSLVSLIFRKKFQKSQIMKFASIPSTQSCISSNMLSCLVWRIYNKVDELSQSLCYAAENVCCAQSCWGGCALKARI